MMYDTLLLDTVEWDLVLDANGNIALAAPPYAIAQDVTSAIRTFQGEAYYDTTLGIPYFDQVLGHLPPASVVTQLMTAEALTVPGTVTAQTTITGFVNRQVSAAVAFTDESGLASVVTF